MASVFEGDKPDARQSDEPKLDKAGALFRKRYRQLSDEEMALHDAIKDSETELAELFGRIPRGGPPSGASDFLETIAFNRGANVTLALRHLEDAVYRAVKALTT